MDENLRTVLRKYDTAFCSVHLDNVSLTIINCKDEDVAKSAIDILTLKKLAMKTIENMSKDR